MYLQAVIKSGSLYACVYICLHVHTGSQAYRQTGKQKCIGLTGRQAIVQTYRWTIIQTYRKTDRAGRKTDTWAVIQTYSHTDSHIIRRTVIQTVT